ncbi:MAG TPA: hypothetical protein PLY43_06335 [Ruminococcus sp.]|nr:hypothetical protein [Ruminococcus sp.]
MVGMDSGNDPISNVVNNMPGIIEKVQGFLSKKKGGSDEESAPADGGVTLND